MSRKFRIAWFSELNGAGLESPSVSAYLTDQLVPLLSDEIEIELFHDKFWESALAPTYHFLTAARRHDANPFDLFFYQFEDREESFFVRSHIGLKPGMVLFHTLLSKSEGPEPFHYSPWESVVKKFRAEAESWPVRNSFPPQGRPFLRREGALAVVPVFSNPRNIGEFKREIKSALITEKEPESPNSFYLPFPVGDLAPNKFPVDETLKIAFLGSPQIEDRAHKILPAIKELSRQKRVKLVWLLSAKERPEAEDLLREFEISDAEIVEGRSPAKWEQLSSSIDLALHPLFSVFGDQTAYVAISLMRGLPSIVTNFASSESFPDSVVLKVFPGEHESREYLRIMNQAAAREPELIALCERARSYAQEIHDKKAVAAEFKTIIKIKRNILRSFDERWRIFESQARAQLVKEAFGSGAEPLDNFLQQEILRKSFSDLRWGV